MNKRLYVGMIHLLVGGTAAWGSTQQQRKVGIVNFESAENDRYLFVDHECMSNAQSVQKINSKLIEEFETFYVWRGNTFDHQRLVSPKTYTEKEMDALLNEENDNQPWKKDAKKAWNNGNVYFLNTLGSVASDTKANYFSGKAKVLSNDGNNDNTLEKPQNNSNFPPAYLLILIPLALIAWVALSKKPTQDKSKGKKASPSPTQADPVQAAA